MVKVFPPLGPTSSSSSSSSSSSAGSPRSDREKKRSRKATKSQRVSHASRCGLVIPPTRLHRFVRSNTTRRVSYTCPVAMAAVIESALRTLTRMSITKRTEAKGPGSLLHRLQPGDLGRVSGRFPASMLDGVIVPRVALSAMTK